MGDHDEEKTEAAATETLDELIRVAVRQYGAGTMWFLARERLGPEHAMAVARALMNGPLDAWRLGRRIRELALDSLSAGAARDGSCYGHAMNAHSVNRVSSRELQRQTEAVLDRAAEAGERVVILRDGRPVAAVVPLADVEWLEEMEDRADVAAAERAGAESVASGEPNVALDDLLARYGVDR